MSLSGITGGAGVFISQFYGKNDISNIRNEYQYRIDSLSKVVKNINSDVTRMKRTSIMNY